MSTWAGLSAGHSERVKVTDLEKVITPDPTKTWTPTPHHLIPKVIREEMRARGWKFMETDSKKLWDISLTQDHMKVFGITKITIPGISADFPEFGFALGFRNSHNKTLSLRFAVGTCVFVCDNLMMTGDFQVRREHTRKIKIRPVVAQAFDMIEGRATALGQSFASMQQVKLDYDCGNTMLIRAVADKALPLVRLMETAAHYQTAYSLNADEAGKPKDTECEIVHGRSLWGWYQAVTAAWKKQAPTTVPQYSRALNAIVKGEFGIQID
jgi:hypothetical protein